MTQPSTFKVFQINRGGFWNKIKHYWENETAKKPSSISDSNSANSPFFNHPSLIGCNLKIDWEENINFGSISMQPLAEIFYLPSKQSKLLRKLEEKMQSWWSSRCEQLFFHGAGNRRIWESKDENKLAF